MLKTESQVTPIVYQLRTKESEIFVWMDCGEMSAGRAVFYFLFMVFNFSCIDVLWNVLWYDLEGQNYSFTVGRMLRPRLRGLY